MGYVFSGGQEEQRNNLVMVATKWFAEAKNISIAEAYDYLLQNKGIAFLEDNFECEQTMSKGTIVDDLTQICNYHNKEDNFMINSK